MLHLFPHAHPPIQVAPSNPRPVLSWPGKDKEFGPLNRCRNHLTPGSWERGGASFCIRGLWGWGGASRSRCRTEHTLRPPEGACRLRRGMGRQRGLEASAPPLHCWKGWSPWRQALGVQFPKLNAFWPTGCNSLPILCPNNTHTVLSASKILLITRRDPGLVFVATAGPPASGSLKLPALGAHIGSVRGEEGARVCRSVRACLRTRTQSSMTLALTE